MANVRKIISGGQTGADRAALDFAIENDIPHSGWCPKGRIAEDGVIPEKYHLQECPQEDYIVRTEQNVIDSNGTVIASIKPELSGGSKCTSEFAQRHGKPWIHIHKGSDEPAHALMRFIDTYEIRVLNVAGPRASEEPEISKFVADVLETALRG